MYPIKPIHEFFTNHKKTRLRFVITTHHRPDADAMGSSLALKMVLENLLGHEAVVIAPNRPPDFLSWMPAMNTVVVYDEETEKARALIKRSDWIFCLDYNTFSRTHRMEQTLTDAEQPKILIDHHQMPVKKHFVYGFSDVHKSSTSEMIFDVIHMLGLKEQIDIATMELLYAGIIGDTGCFAFPSTTVNAFAIAHYFKQRGLATHQVYEYLFQSNSVNKVKFTGYALSHLMQLFDAQQAALIAIPLNIYQSYQLQPGDLEQLVNIPLSIKKIQFSALVVALNPERCKWSFRSLGKIDSNQFARNHFQGGGHLNAAGGTSEKSITEAVKDFALVLNKLK